MTDYTSRPRRVVMLEVCIPDIDELRPQTEIEGPIIPGPAKSRWSLTVSRSQAFSSSYSTTQKDP
jgi:hypothetical protein